MRRLLHYISTSKRIKQENDMNGAFQGQRTGGSCMQLSGLKALISSNRFLPMQWALVPRSSAQAL